MNHSHFYIASFGIWKGCKKPKREPDFESGSSSSYWYGENRNGAYVIRSSDHWSRGSSLSSRDISRAFSVRNVGRIKSCFWIIKTNRLPDEGDFYNNATITGKVYIKDLHPVQREKIKTDLRFFAAQKKAKRDRKQKYFKERCPWINDL